MIRPIEVATSLAASVLRLGAGLQVGATGKRPVEMLELYDFEACPFCRKAREALSMLDLDATVYPCPPGGTRFRPKVEEMGGKQQFPYLIDPNTEKQMYESDEIIAYLYKEYGDGAPPFTLQLGPVTDVSSVLATAVRPFNGRSTTPSKHPGKPLELWSFEASPFCRLAREALCELELPYVLHNVAKGSEQRGKFVDRSGKMMVPYLVDPNTNSAMFESADIVAYLHETYAL